MGAIQVVGVNQARVQKVIGFSHCFTDQGGFSKDSSLLLIRLKGFALLDSKRFEHGHEKTIPLSDRFTIQDIGQP
jgi:hypothetical protein